MESHVQQIEYFQEVFHESILKSQIVIGKYHIPNLWKVQPTTSVELCTNPRDTRIFHGWLEHT